MTSIKCGIVGFGYWGKILFNELSKLNIYDLKVICDRTPHKTELLNVDVVESIDELLAFDIDLVFIATQTKYHKEHILKCFYAAKHVFVEKPITGSSVDANEVISMSEYTGRMLFVDNIFTNSPEVNEIKRIVEHEDITKFYSRRTNLKNNTFDVNILWNLMYHDFYIVNYIFGSEVTNVKVIANKLKHDFIDDVIVSFKIRDTYIELQSSYVCHDKIREIRVIGTNVNLLWDDTAIDKLIDVSTSDCLVGSSHGGLYFKLTAVYNSYITGKDDNSKYESLNVIKFIEEIERLA